MHLSLLYCQPCLFTCSLLQPDQVIAHLSVPPPFYFNYLHRTIWFFFASTTWSCNLPDANQHLNVKPVIGCCDQPLIDWQAIQPILDVHDCFQVWICGGKRWHSWCFCLIFVACMLATTLHPKPVLCFILTLIFTWASLFCVVSFIVSGWTSRSHVVAVVFDDRHPSLSRLP